jgi:hypothetical protein
MIKYYFTFAITILTLPLGLYATGMWGNEQGSGASGNGNGYHAAPAPVLGVGLPSLAGAGLGYILLRRSRKL